ncbi:MAG: sporulation protein YqfD [Oscillospiraceae bacterium]
MFIIKILRYLLGYVRFSCEGGFIERFINLTSREGLNVWDTEKHGEIMTACTPVKHYKKMRGIAKKTRVRLRVRERHGLPFWLHRYRKRRGLFVGLLVFFVFLGFMSNFVWSVEVKGNVTIPQTVIIETLEELGLKSGSFKPALDLDSIKDSLILKVPKLSWVGVQTNGSKVTVNVKERVMPPEMVPDDSPCNIIASKTGQIRSMTVYDGQAVLKVGDTVAKGDIIVSVVVEDKQGKSTFKHARAEVVAQTVNEYKLRLVMNETVSKPTGKVATRRYLRLFGEKLPLFIATKLEGDYDVQVSEGHPKLFGLELPFSIHTRVYTEMARKEVTYTEEEAEANARKKLENIEKTELANIKILDKSFEKTEENGEVLLKATYLCEEDIAIHEQIFLNS